MKFLSSGRYNLVGLDLIEKYLNGQVSLPDKSIAVTLDDGYADNYFNGLHVLNRYSIPATIFLTAGLLGHTNSWDHQKSYPKRRLLTWDHVLEMQACGVCFGAHTMTHPNLLEIDLEKARWEIMESKRIIEGRLGSGVIHFAYPYGLFSDSITELVRQAGFGLACSTCSGFNRQGANPFLLRRIEVYGTDTVWKLKQKIAFGTNDGNYFLPIKYYFGRLKARLGKAPRETVV